MFFGRLAPPLRLVPLGRSPQGVCTDFGAGQVVCGRPEVAVPNAAIDTQYIFQNVNLCFGVFGVGFSPARSLEVSFFCFCAGCRRPRTHKFKVQGMVLFLLRVQKAKAAPAQLAAARGDMVGSESRAGSPRVEEASAQLATTPQRIDIANF